ncbi:MAG: SDR family oxidoreductase [Deltaproteobacteria bacterium]|nr:SDR family oxidoreductase [Deltaproteobacteria bacterium]MBW2214931.1 SDR family oxidoreductase [Deltaproteobacteria bacterium]MBW2403567.1 SDR family oxidoreductase [Deltaproteobacteria bacterium]
MKILLAGGAGYIGSSLIPVLLEHGYTTDVVDLMWFGNSIPDTVNIRRQDIFDLKEVDVSGYDQVIFLAGLSNDPMAEFDPSRNFVSNGACPSYLAYICKRAGVRRFIYASSCSVYGYTVNELYDEESPVTCGYPYGVSKLQGERGVLQLADDDFSVIALRQGTLSGHSPRMRLDLIVNTMFKAAMTERHVTVNNPSIWRPILDIRDAQNAYLRAIQADISQSGVFNVASDNYTVGQVGDLVKSEVERLTGEKVAITIKNISDFRNYKVSFSKAKTYLGFQPQYDVKDIIDDLFSHREEYGDYDRDEFYNIRAFKRLFG